MKRLIVPLFFVFVSLNIHSQELEDRLEDYLSNFQYEKAIEYIDSQEFTIDNQIKKTLCYKALGEYYKAIEVLSPLSEEYPDDIQIKSNLAVCFESVGRREASIECYDSLISLDSTNIYFQNQKAEIFFQQSKYRDALKMFQTIYDQNGSVATLKRIGKCFEKMNLIDSARFCFKKVCRQNPRDAFAVANLINLSLHAGSVFEAVAYSDEYIKNDSTDHQINVLGALSYYRMDDYEEAAKRFTKCYLNGDSSLIVVRSLGISQYSLNRSSEAIPFLEMAYRQDTTNNNVLYCLAISYKDKSEYELAIPLFHKLLDRTIPQDLTMYLYYKNLGESYRSFGNSKVGVTYYEEAMKYAGEQQKMNTSYDLANIYEYSIGDRNKALMYYKAYKENLILYIERLKQKEEDEPEEIARSSDILTELIAFIDKLENSSKRK